MSTETDEYWLTRFQEKYGRAFRQGYFSDRDDMKRLKAEAPKPSESALEAPKRGRGRPMGTTTDPIPRFAERVATDEYGHLVWIGGPVSQGGGQLWFKGDNHRSKYVAYCLLVEDVDLFPGDRYVSECGSDECCEPDCLFVVDQAEIVSRCAAGVHPKVADWAFTVNGKPFCRGCSVFYLIKRNKRTQIGELIKRAGIEKDTPGRDEMIQSMYDELVKYPALVVAEAERALIDYDRWLDRKPERVADPDRIERFLSLASGDFRTLLADDWSA